METTEQSTVVTFTDTELHILNAARSILKREGAPNYDDGYAVARARAYCEAADSAIFAALNNAAHGGGSLTALAHFDRERAGRS